MVGIYPSVQNPCSLLFEEGVTLFVKTPRYLPQQSRLFDKKMNTRTKNCHSENRRKVCGPCGKKIVFGKANPNKFFITAKIESLIKRFINIDFDVQN